MREKAASVEFDVVVAADLGDGIGARGAIPWRLPTDLAHLKRVTTETSAGGARNAVIMGRVTWDTLPERFRPLPGRLNVVVSTQPHLVLTDGVLLAPNLETALVECASAAGVERVFVLGGAKIYRQALELPGCRRIYLTRVLARHDCDAHFPPIPSRFRRDELLGEGTENGTGYRIELWNRTGP